ncbi:GrpB family protein [Lentzea sp. NPDC003310]|uniref:GrpB family protein n=1 Tax=Lentzea sp. NPDC003310 TaxID=3154447 RepID=UPI0033B4DACA
MSVGRELLVVDDPADEASYVPGLEAEGFRLVAREERHGCRVLSRAGVELRVYPRGCAVVWRAGLLRDWLRDHPADRELYASSGAAVEVEILERAWEAVVEEPAEVEFVTEDPPHNAPIVLEDYNPAWPAWFAVEEARIRAALGPVAVRVEHCGSTSVPGLAAKPLIDVVLVVPDSGDEDAYVPALVEAGYYLRLREPDWYGHRLVKGTVPNVNMHVFSPGCVEVDRMLAFRDRLRAHEEDRREYERVKRELAVRTWERVQDYANAKTQVVRRITLRALG